jgi:hypothetical protein
MKNKVKFKRELFSKKKEEIRNEKIKGNISKDDDTIEINIPTPYPKNVNKYYIDIHANR